MATLDTLTHYLRLACERAGVAWGSDNTRELEGIAAEVAEVARQAVADDLADLPGHSDYERLRDDAARDRSALLVLADEVAALRRRVEELEALRDLIDNPEAE